MINDKRHFDVISGRIFKQKKLSLEDHAKNLKIKRSLRPQKFVHIILIAVFCLAVSFGHNNVSMECIMINDKRHFDVISGSIFKQKKLSLEDHANSDEFQICS